MFQGAKYIHSHIYANRNMLHYNMLHYLTTKTAKTGVKSHFFIFKAMIS